MGSDSRHSGKRWQPSASAQTLELRARVLYQVREFFRKKAVLEVETPVLGRVASTDPALESFVCQGGNQSGDFFLQTSPEFAMKRLLANGLGDIYQISKAFRASETGRWHNPEFTLLEWYRTNWSYQALIDECIELIRQVALNGHTVNAINQLTYQALFEGFTGLNPHTADQPSLAAYLRDQAVAVSFDLSGTSKDLCLQLILSHLIEPGFEPDVLTIVTDYPASQAALARLRRHETAQQHYSVAERFEIYWGSLELANGFQELTNAKEQARRFAADNEVRVQQELPVVPADQYLIAALAAGMPDCAGVAMGLDRLIACVMGVDSISNVVSFDFERV